MTPLFDDARSRESKERNSGPPHDPKDIYQTRANHGEASRIISAVYGPDEYIPREYVPDSTNLVGRKSLSSVKYPQKTPQKRPTSTRCLYLYVIEVCERTLDNFHEGWKVCSSDHIARSLRQEVATRICTNSVVVSRRSRTGGHLCSDLAKRA